MRAVIRGWASVLVVALLPAVCGADGDVEPDSVPSATYAALAPYLGHTVSEIELDGHEVTRLHVITREIRTQVGDLLSLGAVHADVQRLGNLQIFSEIKVSAEPQGADRVRLLFSFREMPSWLPVPATTYTEENGFSIGPGLASFNLTGRDVNVTGKSFFGGTRQFWVHFDWPWIAGDNHLGLFVRAAHLNRIDTLNDFEETSDEFSPRVSRYLGEHGRLGGLFSLLRVKSDRPGKTLSPDNDDLMLSLGVSVGWDTRDSWDNPRKGWQNEIVLSRTGGVLGGDADFWAVTVDLRRWQPTARRQKVLVSGLMSLQGGMVGVDIPEYLQYRLGGANSLRGHEVENLGKVLLGRNQLLGTVEYAYTALRPQRIDIWRFSLRVALELAAFADVGTAWNESRELSMNRTRAGVGAGVRLLTPFYVRCDVAWSQEGGFQFHFSGGPKPRRQRDRLR